MPTTGYSVIRLDEQFRQKKYFSYPMKRHSLWFGIGRYKRPVRKLRLIYIMSEKSHVLLESEQDK